ncbi:RNA-dependent RNA polymerase [Hymenopteran arli-related virus OKIAV99]|uniref:RNA-directed RNA polymerase L n=1 Tax=Hymenopteran arli-related virus OKIAV99 TaxID=2792566 RepID=A0AAE7P3Y8_9MONO|nr:RNA-dependent RNA polymerase [Hymenopteran arli-related virus OKIAV99]QPL15345.1 RNA-dependent RNA polymerase [Hymenopteran arli-related virus OKIAV99]
MDYQVLNDAHLQSAIRLDERLMFSTGTDCPKWIKDVRSTCPVQPVQSICIHSERLYGEILAGVYLGYIGCGKNNREQWDQCTEASWKVLSAALKGIVDLQESEIPEEHPDRYSMLSYGLFWEHIKMKMQIMDRVGFQWTTLEYVPPAFQNIYLANNFMVMVHKRQAYLLDYQQIMMLSDTIWGRINTRLFNYMKRNTTPGKFKDTTLVSLYKMFDTLFYDYSKCIYSAVKLWEPIILGQLIKNVDPLKSTHSFHAKMMKELVDTQVPCADEFDRILSDPSLTPEELSELHGLYRHFGHPTVNELEGCDKVYRITRSRPLPNHDTMKELTGALQRSLISTFCQLEGRWPNIRNVDTLSNKKLREMASGHSRHMNLFCDDISLFDWAEIDFAKELNFDNYPDFTELVEDKALAPHRDQVRAVYAPCKLGYHPEKVRRSRRQLKAVLETIEVDIEGIINKVSIREIPDNWKLILLHAKEREMKDKPRLFAMLVFEMKMYFSATQSNIKNQVFRYYPQQTMTLNETDMHKRLLGFTRALPDSAYLPVYIMIDFSSWNIHWSKWSTHSVSVMLDQLFGLHDVYTYGHEFFESCLVALSSYYNPPACFKGSHCSEGDPIECRGAWYNHQGGFEGIMQRQWTIVTIGLLQLVEAKTGIRFQKIGQADNQVCKLYILKKDRSLTEDEYIQQYAADIDQQISIFWEHLDRYSADIGLVTKPEESAASTVVVIYGKRMYVRGSLMPSSCKKISRELVGVNGVYPSLLERVVATQSGGLASSNEGYDPIISCHLTQSLAVFHTWKSAQYSLLERKQTGAACREWMETMEGKIFMLVTCGDIGGLPYQNILNYLYRGHPDSLTSYTTYLYAAARSIPIARKLYTYLQNRNYKLGDGNHELLVSNPCATNIKTYPLLSSVFRKALERTVRSENKNIHLRQLFPLDGEKQDAAMFVFLLSHSPLHPRLAHEIYRLTPLAVKRAFLAKFSNTRTTQILFQKRNYLSAWSDVEEGFDDDFGDFSSSDTFCVKGLDEGLLKHVTDMYIQVRELPPCHTMICPSTLAQDMRDYTWKDIIPPGSKIEGVTVPHPFHQFYLSPSVDGLHDACKGDPEYLSFTLDTLNRRELLTTVGGSPAFVGSRTREKVVGKIFTIVSQMRSHKAAERAILLRTWCVDKAGTWDRFLVELAAARTDVPLSLLEFTAGKVSGGHPSHRLQDHVTPDSTANNFNLNITTHLCISTDPVGRFSRGVDNYVMHFQGLMHCGIAILLMKVQWSKKLERSYHFHYSGQCCEEKLEDVKVFSNINPPVVHAYKDNPLLYASMGAVSTQGLDVYHGITTRTHEDADWALATVLFGRIRSASMSHVVGFAERIDHKSGQIGVQEVRRSNLPRLLVSLAKLLCLYVDADRPHFVGYISAMRSDIWDDYASSCLLPELLPHVAHHLQLDGLPEMYARLNVMSNAIMTKLKSVCLEVYDHQLEGVPFNHPPFHITPSVKINHILRMWGQEIFIKFEGRYQIKRLVGKILSEYHKRLADPHSPCTYLATLLVKTILLEYGYEGLCDIWIKSPLILAKLAPECLLRINPQTNNEADLFGSHTIAYHPSPNVKDGYILQFEMGIRSEVYEDLVISAPKTLDPRPLKTREDQQYRVVGQISTAYLKFMEIVHREGWELTSSALCICDGEGGLSYYLSKLTGKPTFYNSLVNISTAPQHRGHQYIPGAFIRSPELCLGKELVGVTGGDITIAENRELLIKLITKENVTPSVITCDAEAAITFTPITTLAIVEAFCHLGAALKISKGILKYFIIDGLTSSVIGARLQMVWKRVKLVTVCMSSHETSETFWVCDNWALAPEYCVPSGLSSVVRVPNSYRAVVGTLDQYRTMRRSYSHPLQEERRDMTLELLVSGVCYGFQSNAITSFNTLTNHLFPYDSQVSIQENIKRAMRDARKLVLLSATSYGLMFDGVPLEPGPAGVVCMRSSTHEGLDIIMDALYGLRIVDSLISSWNMDPDINSQLTRELGVKVNVKDRKSGFTYPYIPHDIADWRNKKLKALWRVVGYARGWHRIAQRVAQVQGREHWK